MHPARREIRDALRWPHECPLWRLVWLAGDAAAHGWHREAAELRRLAGAGRDLNDTLTEDEPCLRATRAE